MTVLWLISAAALPALVLLYLYLKHTYTYWARKGFPSLQPDIPWGSLRPVVVQQTKSFGERVRDIHLQNPDAPYLGLYFLFRPVLLIRDPKLVKRVLITDFDHFYDRGMFYNENTDPIGANLFVMPGQKWRDLRNKLSPTFTSGKLKTMFPVIAQKTKLLHEHITHLLTSSSEIHLKDRVAECNISILVSVFFGLEMNALKTPDHEFVTMGKTFFEAETLHMKLTTFGVFLCPALFHILRIPVIPAALRRGVQNLMKTAIEVRKAEPNPRNDFIQTIIELMEDHIKDCSSGDKLSLDMCTAQAFLFYSAGYETSASTASFCLYELSKCPEWMDKVRDEVDHLMHKRNGQIMYEDLVELKLLELCIKEAMRMYPALPMLNRECTKEYCIPGTNHVIPKGTAVVVPNWGLQMDEKYFPNPEKFDPSRFAGEEMGQEKLPYYPAGGGPRYCLGIRMGFIMMQLQLCMLIHNFNFTALDQEVTFKKSTAMLTDVNGIRMIITKRVY